METFRGTTRETGEEGLGSIVKKGHTSHFQSTFSTFQKRGWGLNPDDPRSHPWRICLLRYIYLAQFKRMLCPCSKCVKKTMVSISIISCIYYKLHKVVNTLQKCEIQNQSFIRSCGVLETFIFHNEVC